MKISRVLLIRPWRSEDEGVANYNASNQFRNGPYSLLLLATILRNHNHNVCVLDLEYELVRLSGDILKCREKLEETIVQFDPEYIGIGFMSVQYSTVIQIMATIRQLFAQRRKSALLVAGGVHPTVAPESVFIPLPNGPEFDCACIGEADISLLQLVDGNNPSDIPGIATPANPDPSPSEVIQNLDELPIPDWRLCNYSFYSQPTYARLKIRASESLDALMGRGCAYRCNFCAYGTLSKTRHYSADYLLNQMRQMLTITKGVYFLDSTVGTYRKLLRQFCEGMISSKLSNKIEWYANIRSDQVDEELLHLMWKAGCRYLFYGFESGSQNTLNRMNKHNTIENNIMAAEIHNKMKFPYNASMLVNYPGDTIEDLKQTIKFIATIRPPSVGINWYVPLPGSADYKRLVKKNKENNSSVQWEMISQCNEQRFYADAEEFEYRRLVKELEHLAYDVLPNEAKLTWAPHETKK